MRPSAVASRRLWLPVRLEAAGLWPLLVRVDVWSLLIYRVCARMSDAMAKIKNIVVIVFVLAVCGCASQNQVEIANAHRDVTPTPGHGRLVVYFKNVVFGFSINSYYIAINKVVAGSVDGSSSLIVELPEGRYNVQASIWVIRSITGNDNFDRINSLQVSILSGQITYVVLQESPVSQNLALADPSEGFKVVSQNNRVFSAPDFAQKLGTVIAAPRTLLEAARNAYNRGDYVEALRLFGPLAEQGDPVAQNLIGVMNKTGQGMPIDYKAAFTWYSKSAEQWNAFAQNNLGVMYEYGLGVSADIDKAMEFYRLSANNNCAAAKHNLGHIYAGRKDYAEALAWYRRAAEQGFADSQLNIGLMYEYGLGVNKDLNIALSWYKAAMSGETETPRIHDSATMNRDRVMALISTQQGGGKEGQNTTPVPLPTIPGRIQNVGEETVKPIPEERVALVIGNAAYPNAPLRNPVNDALAMSLALRGLGFKVIERTNSTKDQMEKAVIEFGQKLGEGAVGLVYYSGHGLQVSGKNYLIPIDAEIEAERMVPLTTLDLDNVLTQMMDRRSRVSIVILDACRNNPFERAFRALNGGLAQVNAPQGTLIAYATAPGKVAEDGITANGLYTGELLKAMTQPGVPIEQVFKQVRMRVVASSNGNQVPWESSSLTGDFFFLEKNK